MTRLVESSVRWALAASLLVLPVGCAGAGDESDGEASQWSDGTTHEDELTRASWRTRHRFTPQRDAGAPLVGAAGSSSGTPGVGGLVDVSGDCELCARADACCNTVGGGALCTFDALTCGSVEPTAREAYVNACKTLIQTVASVRTAIPSSCL